MPEIYKGRKKIYTSEDFVELQRLHKDNYTIILNAVKSLADTLNNKLILKDLNEIECFAYAKALECLTDIKIETQTDQSYRF
ncbi:hypothetical protein D3C71_1851240 [compost metagenome]